VLGLLRRSPGMRRSPGYLAVHAELSSGAMTNRLDNLEKAGLIRRQPDPNDRRGVQVELTDAGVDAYNESTAAQAAKEQLIASALSAKEKDELNNLLRRLMIVAEQLDVPQISSDE
jgi:DNA-binding MarR family transcriptional regulator